MNSLQTENLGPSILTMQEALSTFDVNEESALYNLKLKE